MRGRRSAPAAALLLLLLPLLPLLVAGCSPLATAERLLLRDHFVVQRGIAYGPGARQRLDVYRPRAADGPVPVVVFLYGGRWQEGSRDLYALLGDALTRQGWVAVVPDYRLYPDTIFPGWVEDAAAAVRWAHRHADEYGGDSTRLYLVGHSAGGHTVALLALDERWLRAAGVPGDAVRGAVSLAGPVDTVWTAPDVQALMGPRTQWTLTYPWQQVDGDEMPLLLLHGSGDDTVAPVNSARLATRVQQAGGCARAIVYRGIGHVELVVALAVPRLALAPVMEDVARFVGAPARMACPPGPEGDPPAAPR